MTERILTIHPVLERILKVAKIIECKHGQFQVWLKFKKETSKRPQKSGHNIPDKFIHSVQRNIHICQLACG